MDEKPTPWRLEQPPKKWENWSRAMLLSSSPIFLGLITVSRMFSMGWVLCRGDRSSSKDGGINRFQFLVQYSSRGQYYSRPGVATNIASESHGHSVSFLANGSDSDRWSIRRALETRYQAISLHNIHPTPLEPIESTWSCFADHIVSKPYMPNGISWIWHTESTELE
ncbi:hypothetical protein TNCV_1606541 [Trichonephila clavipes]|nr:hypothetical protein TNCV_1606541 [Trichonephila clavipes]